MSDDTSKNRQLLKDELKALDSGTVQQAVDSVTAYLNMTPEAKDWGDGFDSWGDGFDSWGNGFAKIAV